jgi:glycosyltransferase involved in cell wall biosynthesis
VARRYKVLFFIPNLQQGGAERQILELVSRLPERFQSTLCVYNDVVHYREYMPPGEPRHVLGIPQMTISGFRRLVQVLRSERPDILHTFRDKTNLWGRLAARSAPAPVIIASVRNRALAPLNLLTERWLAATTDRVLANSEGIRRELVTFARVPAEKIQVIHNFIDHEKFRPPTDAERAEARARWKLGPGEIALLLPGRITLQKNQIGLAAALGRMRRRGTLPARVRVLLAGRRRGHLYPAAVEPWFDLQGIRGITSWLGTVSDMRSLYHAADVLVLPSIYEGLSNAVLEGLASGLPAVVSHAANIDGLVVDGVSGFEVPTLDHAALAVALERMVDRTDGQRREIGADGRRHVLERFSATRVLDEIVALYDGLLAAKGLA